MPPITQKYRFNCSNKRNSWLTVTIDLLVGKKWRRHHSSREQRQKSLVNQPSIDGNCIYMHGDDSQVCDEHLEDCIVQRCKVQSFTCSFQLTLRRTITYSQFWESFSGHCVANPNICIPVYISILRIQENDLSASVLPIGKTARILRIPRRLGRRCCLRVSLIS